MRLVYLPRIPEPYVLEPECRSCRFATRATSGRTVCQSLHMDVRPEWGCLDFQPGGNAAAAVKLPEPELEYA